MTRPVKALITYLLILVVFTGYVLMDTFVIEKVYGDVDTFSEVSADDNKNGNDLTGSDTAGNDPAGNEEDSAERTSGGTLSSDTEYSDADISVSIDTLREYDTTIYVADIQVSSPEFLRTALARGVYGRNIKENTSAMAESNGAVLAINGDCYGVRESGYVIRNGSVYRDTAAEGQEDLVIYKDGSFGVINESEITAEELLANGVVQTLSFGPALTEGGSIAVSENEEISGKAMNSNPRTAIGIIDECHYVFVVSDGRTDNDAGLSLYELAEVMQKLGADTSYNLDGGGSSTMYFNGRVVNNPTGGRAGHGSGSERSVSDIVYIGY